MARANDKVFDAESLSLHDLVTSEGGVAGFRIPIYQRHYNWDKEDIFRLFEDVTGGMNWCGEDEDSLSFLGTIIVVVEREKERTFDGQSLSIIDGQQRLTTISLLASLIHDRLVKMSNGLSLSELPKSTLEWLEQEVDYVRLKLLDFCYGSLRVGGGYFNFPRLVRTERDNRAKNKKDSEYRSTIGQYLNMFSLHIENSDSEFSFTPDSSEMNSDAFVRNLGYLNIYLDQFEKPESDTIALPSIKDIEKKGYRLLFNKLPESQRDIDKAFSLLSGKKGTSVLPLVRLLLFSNYLMNRVHVTLVKTHEEKYAFDIFDSLNTTGEPLTALQTFKPQVIRFEQENGSYIGSNSETLFKEIDGYIDAHTTSDGQQREAKELMVSYAVYLTGDKVSMRLDDQRRYIRAKFNNASSAKRSRRVVKSLNDVACYRNRFWGTERNLRSQLTNCPDRELILMCLAFLKELKTSLSIAVLCRYYVVSEGTGTMKSFADAVKAVTAFVALRRASTGGTAGIDSDLRALMASGRRRKDLQSIPIRLSINADVNPPTISELQEYLREWLGKNRIEISNRLSWTEKVVNQGLYSNSAPLCRFLLLVAFHGARSDKDRPGMICKTRPSEETNCLTLDRWCGDETATVEHIAPDRAHGDGWDTSIYSQPYMRNSIGNLTLLPESENRAASNRSWYHKRKLYGAFAAETEDEVQSIIDEATKDGIQFGKKNEMMLRSGTQLPIMKNLVSVDDWDAEFIKARSINLAELIWDELAPWIGLDGKVGK